MVMIFTSSLNTIPQGVATTHITRSIHPLHQRHLTSQAVPVISQIRLWRILYMFLVKGMLFFEFARTMLGSGSFIAIFSGIVAQGWPWRWRLGITKDGSLRVLILETQNTIWVKTEAAHAYISSYNNFLIYCRKKLDWFLTRPVLYNFQSAMR